MNCIHTGCLCAHAMFCTVHADEITARKREGEVADAEARYASELAATADETLRTLLEHARDRELTMLKRQAYVARVSADASKTDACGVYRDNEKVNKTGCTACAHHKTAACRWVCFREHLTAMQHSGLLDMRENGTLAKVREYVRRSTLTPYQRMKEDGELAAQRAATAARLKKVVDSDSRIPLQCAALAEKGGEA